MKALIALLVGGVLLGSCGSAGPPVTGSPSPTFSPAPSTAPPAPTPPPSPSPTDVEPSLPPPPAAALSAANAAPLNGTLGSVCYLEACGDSPWLPAAGLPLLELADGSDELTVTIADGFAFVSWTVDYADAQDTAGENVINHATGGSEDGPAMTEASFSPPPSGDWVLSVHLVYADGDGDGAYYWHVTVP